MKNFEKYENEIQNLDYKFGVMCGDKIVKCNDTLCGSGYCQFSESEECAPAMIEWLYQEA